MKPRLFTLAAALWLLAGTGPAHGQDPAASPTAGTGAVGKVGLINIQEAIASTQEGKKALGDIQKKYEPKRNELQRLDQEINALNDQLQKQAATLSDEERVRLQRELDEKQRIFKRTQEDDNADFQNDSQEVVRRIGQKMVRVINDYAQKNGFAVIFDPAAVNMPVYYAANGIDITQAIVKLYDAANPVAGGAAETTPAPKSTASKPATPHP